MSPDEVWDVLVEAAGAREAERDQFVHHAARTRPGDLEYRFCGVLGFGGKVRSQSDGTWSVDCYPEDSTPERRAVVEAVNARIGARP